MQLNEQIERQTAEKDGVIYEQIEKTLEKNNAACSQTELGI